MKTPPKVVFMSVLVVAAAGLLAAWSPAAALRAQALENKADRSIAAGEVAVSPAELGTLMHDRRASLALFDLRDESAFNRFHILDARRVAPGPRLVEAVRAVPDTTVKILIADDDRTEDAAYRTLAIAGKKQVYVLAGGIRAWLDLFGRPRADGSPAVLVGALGERHPASDPDIEHIALPAFQAKVKLARGGAKKGPGGCGG